ncbi:MAG: HlyD family efflux transporter periplasmic adaptor subunit [Pseudomonadales bacterium]|nr:HlyD family efflux transporter periplasmic adaptor subunit [Pseudomonadales bacterium]
MKYPSKILDLLKQKWKLLLGFLILIGIVFFFLIRSKASNQEILTFSNPVIKSITKTLEISGHVDAKEKARLRFIAGGKLVYLGAKEGDVVKKWQTIASIDQATLNKVLQKDLNLYMKERWDWEQGIDDNKDTYIDPTEQRVIDKNQWDLDNTVIDVEIQDISIKNASIYAPFAGILTVAPTAVTGVQLTGSDYFEIINPDSLIFRAAIDESDISFIKLAQNAELTLDSFPDEIINTQVTYISFVSTETSGGTAFIVEFPLANASNSNNLRIGMNGDIKILLETKDDVLTIPTIALTQRDDKAYVNVKIGENSSEEREVTTGLETDEEIEIIDGLSQSDQIVIPKQ